MANDIDRLGSIIGTIAKETSVLFRLGVSLSNIGNQSPSEVGAMLQKSALEIQDACSSIANKTHEVGEIVSHIEPKELAESAKSAVQTVVAKAGPASAIATSNGWLDGFAANALSVQVSGMNGMSIGDCVSVLDSTTSGIAFGYQPVEMAIDVLKDIVGSDEKAKMLLDGISDVIGQIPIASYVGMALSFVSMIQGWEAAADQSLVQEVASYQRSLDLDRKARSELKKTSALARTDGFVYAYTEDARARNDILRAKLWEFGGGAPKLADENEYVASDESKQALYKACEPLVQRLSAAQWELRRSTAIAYAELVKRQTDAFASKGQVYLSVDGSRAVEHMKDEWLSRLLRSGAVKVEEVMMLSPQPEVWQSLVGFGYGNASDGARTYAYGSPGSALWNYWNQRELAKNKPFKFGKNPLKIRQAVSALDAHAWSEHFSKPIAFARRHPIATGAVGLVGIAAAAVKIIGGR